MHRLLIIEDEPGIRESLEDYFTGKGFAVTATATAEEGEEELANRTFHMILLDLLLPRRSGLELLREQRAAGLATPVIILTALGEEHQRVEGLRLGADDYLVKPFSVLELHARIDAVLRRTETLGGPVRIGTALVDLAAHRIRRDDREERLLKREARLLSHLLEHPGRTFSRTELLNRVWGWDRTPTTRTVDTQIYNLRRKLEEDPERPRHLVTVHGVGYRLDP